VLGFDVDLVNNQVNISHMEVGWSDMHWLARDKLCLIAATFETDLS
jgi:hypothetical protein